MLELLLSEGKKGSTDYTMSLINSEVVPNYLDDSIPAVKEYREILKDYTPSLPPNLVNIQKDMHTSEKQHIYGFVSFEGFLNAKLLVEVLSRLENVMDKSEIPKAVASISDFDIGITERVSFGQGGNQGLNTIYFNTVQNGRYVPLEDWTIFQE